MPLFVWWHRPPGPINLAAREGPDGEDRMATVCLAMLLAGCGRSLRGDASAGPVACAARDDVRESEVLVVWKLDRLGRRLAHLITNGLKPAVTHISKNRTEAIGWSYMPPQAR